MAGPGSATRSTGRTTADRIRLGVGIYAALALVAGLTVGPAIGNPGPLVMGVLAGGIWLFWTRSARRDAEIRSWTMPDGSFQPPITDPLELEKQRLRRRIAEIEQRQAPAWKPPSCPRCLGQGYTIAYGSHGRHVPCLH